MVSPISCSSVIFYFGRINMDGGLIRCPGWFLRCTSWSPNSDIGIVVPVPPRAIVTGAAFHLVSEKANRFQMARLSPISLAVEFPVSLPPCRGAGRWHTGTLARPWITHRLHPSYGSRETLESPLCTTKNQHLFQSLYIFFGLCISFRFIFHRPEGTG